MDSKYAVIVDEKVINVVLWDGKSEWAPAEGTAVKCPEKVGIGWTRDGKIWLAPEKDSE